MEALCSDAELQQYHPTKQLAGVAQRLVSLNNSNLQLAALSMSDANFQSVENLVERIAWHYTMQVRLSPRLSYFGRARARRSKRVAEHHFWSSC